MSDAPFKQEEKYYVIFHEDSLDDGTPGRLHVKNKEFDTLKEAVDYAATVCYSRKPRVAKLVM